MFEGLSRKTARSLLDLIGKTPLVELPRLSPRPEVQLYARLTDLTNMDLRLVMYDFDVDLLRRIPHPVGAVPVPGVRLLTRPAR